MLLSQLINVVFDRPSVGKVRMIWCYNFITYRVITFTSV